MSAAPVRSSLDARSLARWATLARDGLSAARVEIDEINVFPVPDGDTGTNLHLTMAAAVAALAESTLLAQDTETPTSGRLLSALAVGASRGARGSSGVILAQLLQGLAEGLAEVEGEVGARHLAAALAVGARAARTAVADPVEGTMLTVADGAAAAAGAVIANSPAADSAVTVSNAGGGHPSSRLLAELVRAAATAARDALARTPEQLEPLRLAGVVDAGGRGVCVLLDALVEVVTGDAPAEIISRSERVPAPASTGPPPGTSTTRVTRPPAYEVMFLLDAPAAAIAPLTSVLIALGDSVVVAGAEPTWNVHAHVDDVGAALEAGVLAGRPHAIRVTHFGDAARATAQALPADSRGVVALVAGDGLAALVQDAGATVVPSAPGARATADDVIAGLRAARARDIVVVPNDAPGLAAAEQAAAAVRDEGLRVAVVPTRATVQALAALAVHDPTRRFEDDVVAMTSAGRGCRHGGVTVATREAMTMAGVCRPGDVLGIVDADFAVVGVDLLAVGRTVLDRMLGSGGELVTLVTGEGAPAGLARDLARHVRAGRPEVDAVVHLGGPAGYPLLIGVE